VSKQKNRFFWANLILDLDDAIVSLHKTFFPVHFRKKAEKTPNHVSFLAKLGFRVGSWY